MPDHRQRRHTDLSVAVRLLALFAAAAALSAGAVYALAALGWIT